MDHNRRSLLRSSTWLTVSQQKYKNHTVPLFCIFYVIGQKHFAINCYYSFLYNFYEGFTCFTRRADAEKRCYPVDACGALGAGGSGTVVNVL